MNCIAQRAIPVHPTRTGAAALLGLLMAASLAGCAVPPAGSGAASSAGSGGPSTPISAAASATAAARPPIVFVHGNGDTAALWTTTVWRFESQGWPRERLHAIDLPDPLARDDDAVPQAGRTSAAEHMAYLSAEVDRVLARTGATQVVLVGNSRGGNAIRNYLRNGGGVAKVSHAVLGGTPNHGVWARADFRPGNEFNGAGPFLTALNTPQAPDGLEVTPGVRWLTLRSDSNDKFAQPTGEWIGRAGWETRVDARGPELRGADNRVLPGADHREVSYHARAFEQTWQFVTGQSPRGTAIVPEAQVVLDGMVSGLAGSAVTNRPLAGARLRVHDLDCGSGERRGAPLLDRVTAPDGRWGPLRTGPATCLEFELSAEGYATQHVYRSPFPRSSSLVNLRAARLSDADRAAGAVLTFTRPRGYFGLGRDAMSLDGKPLPGIGPGVPGLSGARLTLPAGAARTVVGEFNGERIAARTWPASEGRVSVIELHH
jgi:pimeloyl-ACP methyl ester carboxylesterase